MSIIGASFIVVFCACVVLIGAKAPPPLSQTPSFHEGHNLKPSGVLPTSSSSPAPHPTPTVPPEAMDRRMLGRLESCYRKFRPEALLQNHRPGKWVTKIWQKDRLFANLSRESIFLSLPTVPVIDYLDANQMKSYIIFKSPGNWGPLAITIRPQRTDTQFAKVSSLVLILNDTVDLSDAVKLSVVDGRQVYSYSTFCAPPGQYRIILQSTATDESLTVELVHKYEQLHEKWPHLDQIKTSKIRCRSKKQNKQMLIKWDRSNVDGNQMQYCVVISNQRNFHNFCEAVANKLKSDSFSCKKFDFLHEGFAANRASKLNATRRLDLNTTSIFCTGTRSQQLFRRFKPNMNYFIDVFGVHPNLSQMTFHLGSHRMWHSTKNYTIPLVEGKSSLGKLSHLNGLLTFSYKPLNPNSEEILLYIVPCGGTVLVKIVRQKKVLLELRHIHKPILQKINMTQFPAIEGGSNRLMIKVFPNSVDEALSNIKVEVTANSQESSANQLRIIPKNLSLSFLPLMDTCNAVEILWPAIEKGKVHRYCILSMVANPSYFDNVGLCGNDEKSLRHSRFHQWHCLYPKYQYPLVEKMRLVDISPRSTYIVYITATLTTKETVKYEPLRIHIERFCHFYQNSYQRLGGRGSLDNSTGSNSFYELNNDIH